MNKKLLNSWNYFINSSKKEADSWIIVSFIPYFRPLVFGILVTLFAFFTSCPSCLAKCKQTKHNYFCIFLTSSSKVTKNQKRKMG